MSDLCLPARCTLQLLSGGYIQSVFMEISFSKHTGLDDADADAAADFLSAFAFTFACFGGE